ncbi:nitrite reductase [Aestuariirhabdus sp. Z084]|uniref:cytochrome D1 domain-containing protein n=1 Tax=Aestuariirhabdus haliotis TaxID=2918751 RepID=UPI00201B37EC|nr:cytochrome D1 domain-containing protein [Aestuariirhabdus haliotis]MCL6416960.1 nitrite reductase [Aestuariirhabdus haliotis]MCL6420937.1 nitrite reductase [Aestuariirhabdus haliotis]
MNTNKWMLGAALTLSLNSLPANAEQSSTDVDAKTVFMQHCASCHGAQRTGGIGPALLPENLSRLRKNKALDVIRNGRVATQMPAFSQQLDEAQIAALADLIYTPLANTPKWELPQIQASQKLFYQAGELGDKPVFDADLMNLFIVVELGDHHATLLDGDKFEPIHRFKTHFALHGGPKYSPDGRYVYFASRDGWISKFDIYNLKTVAEVRAGINTRNLAVSSDGRYAIAANYLPNNLVILDTADLSPIKVIDVVDQTGKHSRVSAVYNAPPRNSFVAALKDIKEVWEINYEDEPPAGFAGWEHNYNKESGDVVVPEPFPIRKIEVSTYLDDFFFNQDYSLLFGASREGEGVILSLDARREIGELDVPGMPHLGSGITWDYQGKEVMATPNLKSGTVSIIDMESWETIKHIKTKGPGFFMRSHEKTPYAWVDVFFGPNKDLMHVIDKSTLEIVKTLKPVPGKTAAHIEFTKDGRYALMSIWDVDGALIVYDAETLEEVKRLPMVKPSGKYNVFNKTTYSRGTSH